MTKLLNDIKRLWREVPAFKIAASYLLFLIILILTLPILPLNCTPNELDLQHTFARPLTKGANALHWLGTDALGRDVWVNILYGARSAFMISIPVMLFSTCLGTVLGMVGGYFGHNGLKTSRAALLASALALIFVVYAGLYIPLNLAKMNLPLKYTWLSWLLLSLVILILYKVMLPLLKRTKIASTCLSFPLDYLVLRVTEAFTSVPRLLLVLALASFLQPSVLLLSIVLAATFWTSTARLARAETLKIKHLPYFESAKSLGVPHWQLLMKHILPNMLEPIVVTFTFGVAGLLTLESTLSFLGIGVPSTFVSWGRIIAGIRSNMAAWWLVVFPGVALATTVWALQTVSYHLLNQFEEKK